MEEIKVKRPILWKLIFAIGLPLLIIYSLILFLNYESGKKSSLFMMKKYLNELSDHYAAKLNSRFSRISELPSGISKMLENISKPSENEHYSLLNAIIKEHPNVCGMAIAYEPFKFNKKNLFAPYVYRENGQIRQNDWGENFNYLLEDWYLIPKLLKKPYWTEPYFDKLNKDVLMCTFSTPVFKDNKFIAVATVDISLSNLEGWMKNITPIIKSNLNCPSAYTFLISQYGKYLYHPDKNDIMRETIFSKAEKHNFPAMRKFGRDMISGKKALVVFKDPKKNYRQWMVYTPILSNRWSFAAVVLEKEIFGKAYKEAMDQFFLMVTGFFVIILIVILASYRITNPIRKLMVLGRKLAKGDLDIHIHGIEGQGEIHALAMVFNKMVIDLKHYIKDLTKATIAREAVDSELRIARNIQVSLIPRIFPPFPNCKDFDLYAKNIPAKEVAGDFYDFFFLDEFNFVFLIADVSGKGISASLFMAVTKTLIKSKSKPGISPDQLLFEINNDLCYENESAMFVTVFYAVLNIKNGELTFSNGGHNLPYLINKNGSFLQLEHTDGIALGVMEDANFEAKTIKLQKDDTLYLYTDGINEAMDKDNNEYSYEKLEKILSTIGNESPRKFTEETIEDVKKFTKEAEQSDDITVLTIKYLI